MKKNKFIVLLIVVLIVLLLILKQKFTSKGRVIASCFAGRKHNMEILLKYIDILLERKYIDEFHVWNFTRDDNDDEYIKSLRTKYKVFEVKDKKKWNEYYEYYYKNLQDNDIIVKIDDDILYIDIDTFPDYINERRRNDCLVLSADVINNGVCAYYQQQNGLLPTSLHTFKYDTFMGDVVTDGILGTKIHEYFVTHVKDTLTKAKNLGVQCVPIGDRYSINFISLRGKEFKLMNMSPDNFGDDEHYITANFSKETNKQCCIYMKFIVAHSGFGPQYSSGLDDKYIVSLYSKL